MVQLQNPHIFEPFQNGRLVHLNSRLECSEVISDPLHGIALGAGGY